GSGKAAGPAPTAARASQSGKAVMRASLLLSLVPTLRVGMPSATLRVANSSNWPSHWPETDRGAAGLRSHAERGNERSLLCHLRLLLRLKQPLRRRQLFRPVAGQGHAAHPGLGAVGVVEQAE